MKQQTLHQFFNKINKIHPSINFTMSHTSNRHEEDPCECQFKDKIQFLDIECKIYNHKIITDLYRKSSYGNQYLLPSSCSPATCMQNIPFSLGLRIVRACSEIDSRELRFKELREFLLDRSYQPGLVDAAIDRARTRAQRDSIRSLGPSPEPRL